MSNYEEVASTHRTFFRLSCPPASSIPPSSPLPSAHSPSLPSRTARELSRAIQRGIPPALRGMVWQLMAATKDPTLEGVYSELLNQPSPHEKSIGRDLGRTFPGHEFFKEGGGRGQENL